jgi:serine/threonine protein kinase
MLCEVLNVQALPPHPNVVQILGVCKVPSLMIIAEFMAKGSLVDWLYDEETGKSKGKLKKARKYAIAADVAAGMRHLHAHNFVHRDLAARNVLLDSSFRGKVADFGMTRVVEAGSSAATAMKMGPVKWMAPEQFSGAVRIKYSTKTDVWSFGVTLFEIFAETEPWHGIDTRSMTVQLSTGGNPGIPKHLHPLVTNVMREAFTINPKERSSMKTLHNQLCTLTGESGSPHHDEEANVQSSSGYANMFDDEEDESPSQTARAYDTFSVTKAGQPRLASTKQGKVYPTIETASTRPPVRPKVYPNVYESDDEEPAQTARAYETISIVKPGEPQHATPKYGKKYTTLELTASRPARGKAKVHETIDQTGECASEDVEWGTVQVEAAASTVPARAYAREETTSPTVSTTSSKRGAASNRRAPKGSSRRAARPRRNKLRNSLAASGIDEVDETPGASDTSKTAAKKPAKSKARGKKGGTPSVARPKSGKRPKAAKAAAPKAVHGSDPHPATEEAPRKANSYDEVPGSILDAI